VTTLWRKSSHSDNNGGACVEVADLGEMVAVRDSKDPAGPVLVVSRKRWIEFVAAVKNGNFG
jgi:Domain of unknown function (DUF397)